MWKIFCQGRWKNYFSRWGNYFGRWENYFLVAGKLFLQVWSPPDNPIQSDCAKHANSRIMECEEFILPDWSPPDDPASEDDDDDNALIMALESGKWKSWQSESKRQVEPLRRKWSWTRRGRARWETIFFGKVKMHFSLKRHFSVQGCEDEEGSGGDQHPAGGNCAQPQEETPGGGGR